MWCLVCEIFFKDLVLSGFKLAVGELGGLLSVGELRVLEGWTTKM